MGNGPNTSTHVQLLKLLNLLTEEQKMRVMNYILGLLRKRGIDARSN